MAEWLILEWGYVGLFIGAFLAATLIPFSSDVLLIAVLMAGGDPYITVILASVGNWLGGLTSYWVGWLGKWEWIEKWFRIKQEKLESQKKHVDKYGSLLALLTWLPIVGDLFAVALGFYRVDFKKSAVFMFIGKFARFVCWTLLYIWLKK